MRNKINNLFPFITLAEGIKITLKGIRKFIFDYIIRYKTLPSESVYLFGFGYHELITKSIKKFIQGNYEFTKNENEDKVPNDSLKDALKFWLITELKHTEKINELIVSDILEKIIQIQLN